MQKKVILFSMLTLSILLYGCGNNQDRVDEQNNINEVNEINLGYDITEGESSIEVGELDSNFDIEENNDDHNLLQGAQDKGAVDNFSDEVL